MIPKSKPVSITVFGIFNLIIGIMGICGTVMSGFGLLVPYLMPQLLEANPNPVLDLIANNKIYATLLFFLVGLSFILSIMLIVGGIGLLQGKSFGRRISIYYAVIQVVSILLGTIVNVIFLFPIFFEQLNGPNSLEGTVNFATNIVSSVLGLVYPVLLLIFMYRPNLIEALKS